MERDADSAGVLPGGLLSRAEIKILICYIMNSIGEPIPDIELSQLLHYEGIANYFEVENALGELLKNGSIQRSDENRHVFSVTPTGRDISKNLKQSIPVSVREKAYIAVAKMMARQRHERDTDIKISKDEAGYLISCAVIEGGKELMSLGLRVFDEAQAQFIKERILDDPSFIYAGVIELLTDNKMDYRREEIIPKA